MTPLHWAVEANNLAICILLLKAGVKTLLRNKVGLKIQKTTNYWDKSARGIIFARVNFRGE